MLEIVRIDNIKWWISNPSGSRRIPVPLCPKHDLRMQEVRDKYRYNGRYISKPYGTGKKLKCEEGPHFINLPREFSDEKSYILNRIDAKEFSKAKVLNLDDEAISVAEKELGEESPYWIKAKVVESKSGTRLIIWAGDKSKKNKAQLFVEPKIKRLSFDQNDDHPVEVFTKIEATFAGDVKSSLQRKTNKP
ncbi:MAG: hypothetical protein R3313_03930 [Candidatus Saccharimonadales bacterium]|nr:hypothetical protein [Candidatus Saccharimonadales bacterium]